MTLVTGIHASNPDLTLREIGAQLERPSRADTTRRNQMVSVSVKNLLDRARRPGLLKSEAT